MAEWLYDRLGWRVIPAYAALGLSIAIGVTVLMAVIGMGGILNATASEVGSSMLLGLGLVSLGVAVGVRVAWPQVSEPVIGWFRDGRPDDGAPRAWIAASTWPLRVVTTASVAVAFLVIPLFTLYAERTLDLDLAAHLALGTFLAAGIAVAWALVLFLADLLLTSMLADIATQLAPDWEPMPSRWTVRTKSMIALPIAALASAMAVAAVLPDGASPSARMIATMTATLGAVLVLAGPLVLVITTSILWPLDQLGRATARVRDGDFTAFVPMTTSDEFGELVHQFNTMVVGLRQRELLYSAMGSYIDPVIADKVAAAGAEVDGELAEVTVMFVDIVGFTTLAEGADPRDVVTELNEFFEIVIGAIVRNGGHANKLLGDGAMAVFGTPVALAQHADAALGAACEIETLIAERYDDQLRVGIGLNSGPVVVGSMGGAGKLDYTIIGDVVNIAARVEAMTRTTGDSILITDMTRALVSADEVGFLTRGEHALKGRAGTVELFAVERTATHARPGK